MTKKYTLSVGEKFNRLKIISKFANGKLICLCDCGQQIESQQYLLKSGKVKSCGCYSKELLVLNNNKRKQKILSVDDDLLFWNKVIKTESCWVWTGSKSKKGYPIVNRNGKTWIGTRYIFTLKFGKIAKGLCVCHTCDNPSCVNFDHLFLGTQAQNTYDKISKKRQAYGFKNGRHTKPEATARGEKSGKSKLNTSQVLEIRNLIAKGEIPNQLALKYNVSANSIYAILHRKSWKHI